MTEVSGKRLVFVLGAGASYELGLPIGSQLTHHIQRALNFDHDGMNFSGGDTTIKNALASSSGLDWYNASRLVALNMPLAPSIDNFVDAHKNRPGVAQCAKTAIAKCILDAERASKIYVDPRNIYNTINFSLSADAWHTLFFRTLTINCTVDQLPDRLKQVGVITFNYDRCFEHFLHHALKNYYDISHQETTKILNNLEIYHPYGQVGVLSQEATPATVIYGEVIDPRKLSSISGQIRTFTETVDDKADIDLIRRMAFDARALVFLGFAFHPINVNLLLPTFQTNKQYDKRVFGTALGSSRNDLDIISYDLQTRYGCDKAAVDLRNDLTCYKLFTEYSRTLSLT